MAPTTDTNAVRGDEVRRLRKAMKLTQYELAIRAGISHPTVQRVERSDETVTRRMMVAIATALGAPLEAIYRDPAPAPTAQPADVDSGVRELVEDLPMMRTMLEALTADMVALADSVAVIRAYVDSQTKQEQHA